MGRYSGDHGPPKMDGTFYAGPSYDTYPTVPPGYAPTAATGGASAVVASLREQYATQGFQGMYIVYCRTGFDCIV